MQKAFSLGPSFIKGQYILAQQFSNPNESICSTTERGWQSQRGEQALWQLPSQQPYDHLLGGGVSDQDRTSLGREAWNEAEVPRFQVTVPSKALHAWSLAHKSGHFSSVSSEMPLSLP